MNNYETMLPNKKALFDNPVERTAIAYLTSLVLVVSAFIADGSFNGGDNALNVLPYAVEGIGVPVDPLAFAGLLGMVVISLNLLPYGRIEGRRITQAMFGPNGMIRFDLISYTQFAPVTED